MRTLPALTALAGALTLSALAAPAAAATFSYSVEMPNVGPGSANAGQLQSLAFGYDDGGDSLSGNETLDASGSIVVNPMQGVPDGGWIVLSDGRNAREENGLAILYMDFSSGTVVAYEYDGSLNRRGFRTFEQQDRYIATFENAVTSSVRDGVFSFEIADLNVNAIQTFSDADDFTGVSFGEQIGIWFHLAVFNEIEIGPDGRVTRFAPRADSFYDAIDQNTVSDNLIVPLPAGGVLLLTGLAGVAAVRRRAR